MFVIPCPFCGRMVGADETRVGQPMRCGACQNCFLVPQLPPAPAAPPPLRAEIVGENIPTVWPAAQQRPAAPPPLPRQPPAPARRPTTGSASLERVPLAEGTPEPPAPTPLVVAEPDLRMDEPLILPEGPAPRLESMSLLEGKAAPESSKKKTLPPPEPAAPSGDVLLPEGPIGLAPSAGDSAGPARGRQDDRAIVFTREVKREVKREPPAPKPPSDEHAGIPRMELDEEPPAPRRTPPSPRPAPPVPPPIPVLQLATAPEPLRVEEPEPVEPGPARDPLEPDSDALKRLRKARKRARREQSEGAVILGMTDWVLFLSVLLGLWALLTVMGLFVSACAWILLVLGVVSGFGGWALFGSELERDPWHAPRALVTMGGGLLMMITGGLLSLL